MLKASDNGLMESELGITNVNWKVITVFNYEDSSLSYFLLNIFKKKNIKPRLIQCVMTLFDH